MVEPEKEKYNCGDPNCPGHESDGLEKLSVPELMSLLETRKAMLVWGFLLYPSKGALRSYTN